MSVMTEQTAAYDMIPFEEIEYQRPDMAELKSKFETYLAQMEQAADLDEFVEIFDEVNATRLDFDTKYTLVSIRHTVDTRDEYYEKEQDFFDENTPLYSGLINDLYKVLLNTKYRPQLEAKYGKHLFNLAELSLNTFKPEVVNDLQKENALSSEFTKLLASAKIDFEGEERNLAGLTPFEMSPDRDMRRKAVEAKFGFLAANQDKLDRIYDDLVKVRTSIAKKLGYNSFTELAYARLTRSDYNAEMVAAYRERIRKYVVPVATKLRERQAKRLGLDDLKFIDEALDFTSGNATPKGPADWIVENGAKMYKELSPETDEFYKFMTDYHLLDLVAKPGKAPGGYCTFLPNYRAPFIYSNFNGTSGDIDVLTHEAGHAFQIYQSRNMELPEYHWPTYEACEIHSMSMEFFAWPWMELFFKEDTDKYKFGHLASTLLFLPYGVAVDEFQHEVYGKPEMTPAERHATWRAIEKKYLPHRNYEGNAYLEQGGFWQKQSHIFNSPFYYIDYTLAQVCALQFWVRSRENMDDAWADYLTLCKAGGSKPFLDLVDLAGVVSPFKEGSVEEVVAKAEAWLDQVDDTKL